MPDTRRPTVYALVSQARAVRDLLGGYTNGPLDIVQVDRQGQTIMGLQCGVFVNITTHVCQPPPELWDRLRMYGFVIWTIDDSNARARLSRLMNEHEAERSDERVRNAVALGARQ